ncbi:MAG: arsenate reductase ArsC [Chloroflexota bacterium]
MAKVMFLCTGNSCRSQMAEGFVKFLTKGKTEAFSAGLAPAEEVHPMAVLVMAEIGIDISGQRPKPIDGELLNRMDVVITLCDNAAGTCPWTPPHVRRLHWPLRDPVTATGTEEQRLTVFRQVRDDIRVRTEAFLKEEAQ